MCSFGPKSRDNPSKCVQQLQDIGKFIDSWFAHALKVTIPRAFAPKAEKTGIQAFRDKS